VLVTDGRVAEVGGGTPPRRPDLALGTGYLVPGLIDLQVNGYFGVSLADVEPAGWALVARRLPETGTTGFLPTFVTAPVAEMSHALRCASVLVADPPAGARVLGVHMEGPFLAPTRAGAHRREWMVTPTQATVANLLTAGAGALRVVTLAPEVEGGLAAGRGSGIRGGGRQRRSQRRDGAAGGGGRRTRGARMVTHLFNAQRPLHHREPGVVGQALTDPRLTSGLIADLTHVAAAACAIAFAAAPGRICLVTDASAAAGMAPGRYRLGGKLVEVRPGDDQAPRLADGTLAGSVLRMDRAVANAVAAGVGLAEAVAAATRIRRTCSAGPDLGRLNPGAAADLVWLDDDLRAQATWVAGEPVYPAGAVRA
jgi:N-acetylglucosamine-6-phosphate deacetylase